MDLLAYSTDMNPVEQVAYSTDMNSVEQVWDILRRRVVGRLSSPQTIQQLKAPFYTVEQNTAMSF